MSKNREQQNTLQLEVLRQSLDDQAADQLRDAILSGQISPGVKLTEEFIAGTFGLSRGTIRASLRKLAHEGLIVQMPYKGYSVKGLSSRDAWELFTLRNSLESFSARLLAESISPDKARRLGAAFNALKSAVESGSRGAAVKADFSLHDTIVGLTGHSALQVHYGMISGQVRLYQSLVSKFLTLQDYVEVHEPLINAILDGRTKDAEQLASIHNTADGEELVALLKRTEAEDAEVSA